MTQPDDPPQASDAEAHRAQRQARALWRTWLAVIEHAGNGTITDWNDAATRLFGFTRDEAIGRSPVGLIVPEHAAEAWEQAHADGAPRLCEHVTKDGARLTCEWSCTAADGADDNAFVLCIGQDVTAHVNEVMEARRTAKLLRVLMDSLPVCVWAVDRDGIFVTHDGKGLAAAGLKPGDHLGKSVYDLYPEKNSSPVTRALQGESTHNQSEAHDVPWESWVAPIRDDSGEIAEVVGITLDVSESKRVERELRDKLALIERQQRVITDLGTPIIQVWERVLTLPMIGVVDSARTAEVMDRLLEAVSRIGARYAILDLTGVDAVDTKTASYLLEMIRAVQLLGAEGIITGIRPTVAQTVVELGADLSSVPTLSNLSAALRYCIRRMTRDQDAAKAPPRGGTGR